MNLLLKQKMQMKFMHIVAIVIGALFLITLLQGLIHDARSGVPHVKWYSRAERLLGHLLMTGLLLLVGAILNWLINLTGGPEHINMLLGGFLLIIGMALLAGIAQGFIAIVGSILESSDQLTRRFGQGPYQP